jgi:signal transduction histidine kinase
MSAEERVVLFTPTGRDSAMIAQVFRAAGIDCVAAESWAMLERMLAEGAATLIIAEEGLQPAIVMRLRMILDAQPPWSDLPVLILTAHAAESPVIRGVSMELGNVTLLERPMRAIALLSATRSALRSRRHQYDNRAQLQELERTAAALRASEAELREAHTRKDEFLAMLAHELRNPLAPIRNALHLMRRPETEGTRDALHAILDRQVRQLVRLVDDLLEVSRFTRGKIPLQMTEVDIGGVLRSSIETSRPLIEAAGHQLMVSIPDEALKVRGDSLRLGQVFSNLLNNAAKYTPARGVLELTARREDAEAVVDVQDTGVGIPPEMLHSIFDMFTQVRESKDRAQGGLGIGLTLARTLVELHGGHIEAHSDGRGAGSRFRVRLRLAGHDAGS